MENVNPYRFLLDALIEIRDSGKFSFGKGLCLHIEKIHVHRKQKLRVFYKPALFGAIRHWSFFSGDVSFPISVTDEILEQTQYEEVFHKMEVIMYTKLSGDFINEYLGMRLHLLYHLINYFEDKCHEYNV